MPAPGGSASPPARRSSSLPPEAPDRLGGLIAAELARPARPEISAFARSLAETHGDSVLGVLFYGSCRRRFDGDGLLDFYILYDRHRRFHRTRMHSLLNAALPPNVMMATQDGLHAKVATLSLRQFARAMRADGIDTTMWARFTQPSSLLYARDDNARAAIAACIRQATTTATGWARKFSPAGAPSRATWERLFTRTYAAELRPERGNRPADVYDAAPDWFDTLLATSTSAPSPHGWRVRRIGGRALNALRLAKATLTFDGAADYVAWKLERHAGIRLAPSDWQRRHPLLAGPGVLWRLWREGMFSQQRRAARPDQSAAGT